MYAHKPTDPKPPESYGRLLLIIGFTLALLDGCLFLVARLGTRYLLPKLHALRTFASAFAPHTTDPATRVVIEALRNEEIYLYSQLIAVRDILLTAHAQYVQLLWRFCLIGFGVWCLALLLVRALQTWARAADPSQSCPSPMGITYEGRFIPCPLPTPILARVALVPTPLQRWAAHLGLHPARRVPAEITGLPLLSPLAGALLEHYLAYPGCPAEIPTPTGSGPSHRHGTATLLEHVLAVRAQALSAAEDVHLPAPLVEQGALAHDLGKLATFHQEDGQWIRAIRHHDRMSGQLLTAIPEWQALPSDVREDLRLAVRFHHAPDRLHANATWRAKALLGLIAHVHKETSRQEADAAGVSDPQIPAAALAPPPAPSPGPAPPAPSPVSAGPADPPPVDTASPTPSTSPPALEPPAAPATPSASKPPEPAAAAPASPKANQASPLLPVDPALQDPLMRTLVAALPRLCINSIKDFTGLTIPDAGLVVLLDPPLRATLAQLLTPDEGSRLQISAIEAQANSSGSKTPVPHAADANLAAAFRRLGWLVERYQGQSGTLWRVKVGRRIWLACWLLDLAALPREATAGWPSMPKYPATPTEPSWTDPYRPAASPEAPPSAISATPPPPTPDGASARPEPTGPGHQPAAEARDRVTPSEPASASPSREARTAGPPGRITPGLLLALSMAGGVGWFLVHPPAERTGLTCDTVDAVAQWVKGDSSTASAWSLKVKDSMDSLRAACPRVLDTVSPTLDKAVESATERAGSALHTTVGGAKQIRDARQIVAVLNGTTVKIGGIGEARLLGITVPPETQAQAQAYLEQTCLRKGGAPRRLVVHLFTDKDAEGYPLVVVYADHGNTQELTPDLAVNQQLLDQGLAQPWSLPVCTDRWSNAQPRPADCTQG